MVPTLVVFGAGGLAREAAMVARRLGHEAAAFVDRAPGPAIHDIPVMTEAEAARRHPGADAVIAVGDHALRRRLAAVAADLGFACPALIDPTTVTGPGVGFADGVLVLPGAVFTVDVAVGAHVLVNPGVTIAHDVAIGAFASLSPGVHVAGNVAIGEDAFLGIGASVANGRPGRPLTIGAGAFVAAGATVTAEVAPGLRVAGVPARPLPSKDLQP
ncbi:NeuD/PglB/VioB family sugar acetyltransferase [Zavarzinia compransoris]|uniref:NeuD/PglB/VioB family sugar acetyltransferase n=1 Tax=Zavarzinia marina TaxID=2911065 RepID=UPI001EEF215D|nr:NeuD/PglB/VioB family sugar acetyltransferase [Zavarzinia marina]MCF4164175.1 NeuD/PglB/VioB family sugar acetyltransferase [Zavarzinia marina]